MRKILSRLSVGFWQNGFFADFYFWAAGFFRGFRRRIFSPHFCGKSAQEIPPGKSPAKSSNIYTRKIPDTFLQRGWANTSLAVMVFVRCREVIFALRSGNAQGSVNVRKAPDTFNFLRHVMRAIWSVRPKCSHRCVSLKETPLKPVQSLKHTTKNSAEQTVMRTKWFKHIAI